ncbi:glutamine synthetase [Leekyejoonella antrihumi]|uniref:Glutamine synthetase n=2 Tax=Leekyejoonella antrihumi TaxID=1660198 RepID=A0A563E2W5_9MICO|nr:glutamine synthetase [Leekyejoonella antrihumi]
MLADRDIVGVATTFVDNSGITRTKAVPVERLVHAAVWGIGMSPVFDAFLSDDSIVAGRFAGSPIGDLRLYPDLSRLTVLAGQPGWAWAPADRCRQDGTPHPQDQRTLARRVVTRLAEAGYTARMAFEIEWAAGINEAGSDDFIPAVHGPAYGFTRMVEASDYLRDLARALAEQGIQAEQIHPEYAAGQFEVSVAAEDPIAAADTFVLARETIRAVSLRHGMRASFSPKTVAGGVGNGGHVHLSLWASGRNIFAGGDARYGMTEPAEMFSAGILHHLPALLAVGTSSAASYLRLIPQHWAGAFQAWGLENRETALRFVTGSPGDQYRAANLEVKAFDESANPYLVVAGLLSAGLDGLATGRELPDPVEVDPALLLPAERVAHGITQMPASLGAVADAFEADDVLNTAFGDELAATIVELRRAEHAMFVDASEQDIAAAVRWKY